VYLLSADPNIMDQFLWAMPAIENVNVFSYLYM